MTITPQQWNAVQASGDPRELAQVSHTLAEQKTTPDMDFRFTICDKMWVAVGNPGTDLMEASGTDPRNDVPSARLKIKGDSVLVPELAKCKDTLVGVIVETAGLRYAFYVDTHEREYKDAAWTSTANCLGIYSVLNYMLVWPDWFLPIAAQLFSHAVFIGPIVTVIETMIAQAALRIQSGWLDFINNALSLNLDIQAWNAVWTQSNGNIDEILKTPMYVVRTNPLLDTSPQVAKTVRMQPCAQVIKDISGPYGIDVDVSLWLPGDDQPDQYADLDQPTYVVRVKDRSQIEGPTKTILDSSTRTTVDLLGSLLGHAMDPILNPNNEYHPPGTFTAPALGVNFVMPYAVIELPAHGEKSPVISAKMTDHSPRGWRQIIGGKSPKWLTDAVNAFFSWMIDSASIVLGFTGIPSNMLDGFLADSFLAFQLIDNWERRQAMGPYHPAMEVFTPTEGTYDIETLFSLINALWDTRGYTSATLVLRDGQPYKLGRDIFRGGLLAVIYDDRTKMFTDHVENIMWRITPRERTLTVQVGDNKSSESPLAKHQRYITGIMESINVLTLAPRK